MSNLDNIHISDCLIWSDFARGIVIGPEAGNASVSDRWRDRIADSVIYADVLGSDHCPVGLLLK